MQYFTLISMAMMSLSRMFVMYTKCAASAKRISLVLERESELKTLEKCDNNYDSSHISFENVSFSYLGKENNLKNISFSLKKGESLGSVREELSRYKALMREIDKGSEQRAIELANIRQKCYLCKKI